MKLLGRASASRVVAAYRQDLRLREAILQWPMPPAVPLEELPLRRLAVLVEARRPLFWALEVAWDLYEATTEELLAVRAMWGDPPTSER
jgi:hypothetical protein